MAAARSVSAPFFLLLLLLSLVSTGYGSASAPTPAVDCSSLVLNMADCLSFVTSGSTVSKPEGTCCSGLKMVLKTGAHCLCEAFKSSASFGITLNVTKALSLPDACKVHAPPAANCGISLTPASAPVEGTSPTAKAASAPELTTSANVVAPAPAPAPGSSSSSSSLTVSVASLIGGLFAVLFSSF